MSGDLISRAKVIENIDYWIAHKSSASRVKGSFTDGMIDAYCRIKSDVRLMPSAEPQRKRGVWIDTGSGQECSVCHEIQYGYDNFRHYCPNCGADMRGGDFNDL